MLSSETCERTDKQLYRHGDRNTSHPYRGGERSNEVVTSVGRRVVDPLLYDVTEFKHFPARAARSDAPSVDQSQPITVTG